MAVNRITSSMAQASICTLYHTAIVKDRLPTGANLRIPTANPCSRLRVLFEGEVDLRLVSLPIAPSKQAPISGVRAQTPATKSPPISVLPASDTPLERPLLKSSFYEYP